MCHQLLRLHALPLPNRPPAQAKRTSRAPRYRAPGVVGAASSRMQASRNASNGAAPRRRLAREIDKFARYWQEKHRRDPEQPFQQAAGTSRVHTGRKPRHLIHVLHHHCRRQKTLANAVSARALRQPPPATRRADESGQSHRHSDQPEAANHTAAMLKLRAISAPPSCDARQNSTPQYVT